MDSKQILQLISLAKKNPPLWNKGSHGYRDAKAKLQAWDAIGAIIKPPVSGIEASAKFKYLRETLGREYKKVLNSMKHPSGSAGSGRIYEPKWPFYPEMEFLKDYVQPRDTQSNMSMTGAMKEREQMSSTINENVILQMPSWLNIPASARDTVDPEIIFMDTGFSVDQINHEKKDIILPQLQNLKTESAISVLKEQRNFSPEKKSSELSPFSHPKSSNQVSHKRQSLKSHNSLMVEDTSDEEDNDSYFGRAKKQIKLQVENQSKTQRITPPLDAFALKKNQRQNQWGEELAQAASKTVAVLEKLGGQSEKKVDSLIEDIQRATAIIPYSLLFVSERLRVKCIREMLQVVERYQEESLLEP